jgi:predicted transcriptional regulator YdeE
MNNYILRIYRLSRKKPHSLVGLVEEVGVKEKKAFTNIQELWEIVSKPKGNHVETKRR